MDLKNLLGKLDVIEGTMTSATKHSTGPKFTGYWKGSDEGTPGTKMVGGSEQQEESLLKDLSKGRKPKSKEQELSEEFQAFLEAEFQDTVDKRPGRKSDRPARGHEPQPRYTTIKTENWPKEVEFTPDLIKALTAKGYKGPYKLSALKNLNRQLNGVEGISGDDNIMIKGSHWVISAGSEFLVGAEGQMAPATTNQLLKHLDESSMSEKDIELQDYRSMSHKEFQAAYGMTKTEWINKNKALVIQNPDIKRSLGINESHYKWEITFRDGKQAVYQQNNPHYNDKTAASDIAYSVSLNPGSRVIATKDGKPFDWQSLLSEGWESGPEEYEEPYDDADDAYDRQRQEKIDTEVEREWAKLPKVSTYKLTGRGPNMEPNYEFGDEFDTLEQALKYREEIMKDPKTPYPEHIGIRTITRVKDQTNEAVMGGGQLRDYNHYLEKRDEIYQQLQNPKQKDNWDWYRQALFDLNRVARSQGFKVEESRGHKVIATKLGNIERAKNFRVPSAEERKELAQRMKDFEAQLAAAKKDKKQVKEFVASQPTGVSPYGQPIKPATDPKQAQAVAQATQTIKAATGSTAPNTNIAKALDAASQGKPVGQADMKVLEPVMKDVATIAQDPKLAGQFKTLAQQVNQAQLKQKQQQNQQQK